MKVQFWGVRGSVPTPGERTSKVGGNTSCVSVTCGDTQIILDAGTGIRSLGNAMLKEGRVETSLLLSHLHWDHIQGIPFFVPAYLPTTKLHIIGHGSKDLGLKEALSHQMTSPVFPVEWNELPSYVSYRQISSGGRLRIGDVEVTTARLNHPGGGVTAYRLDYKGRSMVYATDTEHYACVSPVLSKLARDCDLLVYDSMYTADEYAGVDGMSKVGWGHSTWEAGVRLAEAANVGTYALFHHDPDRDDAQVDELERRARSHFSESVAAREGMVFTLRGDTAQAA